MPSGLGHPDDSTTTRAPVSSAARDLGHAVATASPAYAATVPPVDPRDPLYLDEADVRDELTRVFDVCGSCRACVDLCGVFPNLFALLDRTENVDAGLLTPFEQDGVVDACFDCDRCVSACPYAPGRHAAQIDVPGVVLRARAMRFANRQVSIVDGFTAGRRMRSDGLRRLASSATRPHSRWSPASLITPSVKQRFSTWFDRRGVRLGRERRSRVVLYPTCLVEFQATSVGLDAVTVLEHDGIECSRSDAGCCGAPWLRVGDRRRFAKMAATVVRRLASEIRASSADAVVVLEPTCRSVMQREYAALIEPRLRADAEFVTDRILAPSAYLLRVHERDGDPVGDAFPTVPSPTVAVHAACHARSDDSASTDAELLRLCGYQVEVVEGCAGVGGRWSTEAVGASEQVPAATDAARLIGEFIVERSPDAGPLAVVGQCSLANRALAARAGLDVTTPLALLARAIDGADRDRDHAPNDAPHPD